MSSTETKLVMSVLSQVEVGRIDYDKLAKDIGVATPKAARCRWDRYRQKLAKGAGLPPTSARKAVGASKKIGAVSPKKAGGSPKKSGRESLKKSRGRAIKRESDEDEEEEEVNAGEEGEEMDYDKEGTDVDIKVEEPVTPLRKLPYRQARVTKFVEETSDAEDEQEEEDGDVQDDPEVDGMGGLAVKDEDDEDWDHIDKA
ncbi:hypothetical protein SBOR_8174 [Sclerotinia borealis F-4128]|uniref:Myb-like DNA-binding domain-containing protein n=1 Tax=Sclerotinia borealis (strain F-4128) TaxID=1432307 RepID=W9C6G5_SCLBF|nr:hypothetical protein SBOR_8174 [Sclerotinia borealis F-4128]